MRADESCQTTLALVLDIVFYRSDRSGFFSGFNFDGNNVLVLSPQCIFSWYYSAIVPIATLLEKL